METSVDRSSTPEGPEDRPPFITYIEGLRGLFGVLIVVAHFRQFLDWDDLYGGPTSALLPGRALFLAYFGAIVCMFLVVSGFVLTIPVARRGALRGGILHFISRRAQRMVPPYYAAIVMALPLYIWLLHVQHLPTTVFAIGKQIVAHALFVENFSYVTLDGLDGPMWSVAVEWQVYLLFAALFIPLTMRYGLLAPIAVGFAIGCTPSLLALHWHIPFGLQVAHLWYYGVFAMGSAAAFVSYAPSRYPRWQDVRLWRAGCYASCVVYLALVVPGYPAPHPGYFVEIPLATGFSCWLVANAIDERRGKRSWFVRFYAARPFVWLGTFSYSLYLIHFPLVQVVMYEAQALPPSVRIWVPLIATPAIVAIAFAFALAFEFPFISTYYRSGERAALARSPAPPPSAAPAIGGAVEASGGGR